MSEYPVKGYRTFAARLAGASESFARSGFQGALPGKTAAGVDLRSAVRAPELPVSYGVPAIYRPRTGSVPRSDLKKLPWMELKMTGVGRRVSSTAMGGLRGMPFVRTAETILNIYRMAQMADMAGQVPTGLFGGGWVAANTCDGGPPGTSHLGTLEFLGYGTAGVGTPPGPFGCIGHSAINPAGTEVDGEYPAGFGINLLKIAIWAIHAEPPTTPTIYRGRTWRQFWRSVGGNLKAPANRMVPFRYPTVWPALDAMSIPINEQTPTPIPLPYRMIPYRRQNPYRVPQEQSSRGPVPPGRDTPQRRFVPHKPPGPRTKEKKLKVNPGVQGAYQLAGRVMNAVTETDDFVNALWDALPEKFTDRERARRHGRRPKLADKFGDLYQNWGDLDFEEAWNNVLANEVQDQALGRLNKAAAKGGGDFAGSRLGYSRRGEKGKPKWRAPSWR